MKELTIEQKAKRYDEAYKVAENIHRFSSNIAEIKRMEEIFPELKENEDERIREKLIDTFKFYDQAMNSPFLLGIHRKDILAWLEKQCDVNKEYWRGYREGKQEVLDKYAELEKQGGKDEEILVLKDQIESLHAAIKALKEAHKIELEKQGRQKPAEWDILSVKKGDILSDGTIVLIVDSIGEFEGKPIINSWYFTDSKKFFGKGTSDCDKWEVDGFRIATNAECNYLLKMMADAGYEWDANNLELREIEQKPAWSEEDEVKINRIVACLENLNVADNDILLKDVDWLKSLKDRVQPKQKWSEEDEMMIKFALTHFRMADATEDSDIIKWLKSLRPQSQNITYKDFEDTICKIKTKIAQCNGFNRSHREEVFDLLDSLRPQHRWKPSEEQMNLLEELVEDNNQKHFYTILRSLYEQLKKLVE